MTTAATDRPTVSRAQYRTAITAGVIGNVLEWHDFGLAVVAQLLMVLLYVPYAGACPAFHAEIFPTRVRYTALSIGYNIAVAIFGGFAPFIATFLVRVTDNSHAPAVYVIIAAIITLIVLVRTRETAFAPLR
jgi:MHS family proline/betaine transporter-like MFS transporter